jgi:UDPglucose 6-dehydrogenase
VIGFAGLSHLGIVSSVAAAAKGFDVVAYDPDVETSAALTGGHPPIAEPGLQELIAEVRPRIRYTADASGLGDCDLIYISADVPTDAANRSDSTPVEALLRKAARAAAPGTTLVVLSQVTPGFSRGVRAEIESFEGKRLRLYYQVETLVFGIAVERALEPERFIVGCGEPAEPLPRSLQEFLASYACPILTMRYESAELAKLAINHFLAASVGMTNTLAELCEGIGADWSEIAPALRLDRRIGPHAYLTPGLGIAGGNIERDLATSTALASQCGTDAGIVQAIVANSRHRQEWALRAVRRALDGRPPGDARVALWGLAYKPDTASTKNSPALMLVRALEGASVSAYDPQARVNGSFSHLTVVRAPLDACREADVLVVMTPWKEFAAVEIGDLKQAMRGRVIVDPFAALDGARCTADGFFYTRLGRAPDA